jgi:hypothetical protein
MIQLEFPREILDQYPLTKPKEAHMEITPDFSEAPENTPVPEGVYKARITDVEQQTAKTSGAPMLNWKLQIFDSDVEGTNNRVLFHRTMVTGKGAFMLRDLLKATGTQVEKGQSFNAQELLGKEVQVAVAARIDNRTGEQSPFPEVKAIRPLH